MSKKFFILGGYLSYNPGDIAILKATLASLDRLHPGSRFVIWCDKKEFSADLSPELASEYFVHRGPAFFMSHGPLQRSLLRLYLWTYPFSRSVMRLWRTKEQHSVVRKIKECDYVVFIGGGYINSNYAFDLMQLHHLSGLAEESGRPVYFLGQTVGPFKNRWYRRIAGSMFRGAERIVTRERYSASELGEFKDKVVEGTDDAIGFRTISGAGPQNKRTDSSQVLLGLNLRSAEKSVEYPKIVDSLNQFNTKFAGGHLKVIFIPMVTSTDCDDQNEAALFGRSGNRNFEYEIISGPLTVEERLAAVSKTDVFLGMRFHSLVFALSNGVPCIGLYADEYYLRKNRGLFETYGVERYALPMDRLSELTGLMGDLYQNRVKLSAAITEKHNTVLIKQAELYASIFKS